MPQFDGFSVMPARSFAWGIRSLAFILFTSGGCTHRDPAVEGLGSRHAPAAVGVRSVVLEDDPSIELSFAESDSFASNSQLAARLGAVSYFEYLGSPSSSIIMTFEALGSTSDGIDAYCSAANAAFAATVSDRRIESLALSDADAGCIHQAKLPWRAFMFVTKVEDPASTSICDAGAIRFETPGGFWTISWNSNLGAIEESTPVIREFLGQLQVDRVGD